jgi:hypothetical protein
MTKRLDVPPPVRPAPINPRDVVREIAPQLTAIEARLHLAGLHATAKAVNEATRALGWDACEIIDAREGVRAADRAARRQFWKGRVQS